MANLAANNTPAFSWWKPTTWDGERITQGLRAFNNWRDDFLIELTTLLLMVGFVVGTIDVLTSGGLSQVTFINYAWAIVQAIAIDGLFFAVWGKIRRLEWTWRLLFSNIMLIAVGLLLAVVAALVNNILGYEELNHVATLAQVMQSLGVDATIFSYVRSTLVVLVSILVALFARSHGPTVRELMATIAQHVEEITGLRAMRDSLTTERDGLSQQATALEKERDGLRAMVEQLEKEQATRATEFESERASWAMTLESERASWATMRGELEGEIEDIKKKLAQARTRRGHAENNTALALQSRGQGLQATMYAGYSPQNSLHNGAMGYEQDRAIDLQNGATGYDGAGYDSPQNGAMGYESTGYDSSQDRATGYGNNGYSPGEKATGYGDNGYVARDDGTTIAVTNGAGETIVATGEVRDRIKMAIIAAMQRGEKINYKEIAQEAQAGYSTVKKHAPAILEEITQEIPAIVAPAQETQQEENKSS